MAIKSTKKAPKCSICGYDGSDHVYMAKDSKSRMIYHRCPSCGFAVEYGRNQNQVLDMLGLKINEEKRIIEEVSEDDYEENNIESEENYDEEERYSTELGSSEEQGIEARDSSGSEIRNIDGGSADSGGTANTDNERGGFLF
jgi:hypothetical protein